jgi:hypothetical protein
MKRTYRSLKQDINRRNHRRAKARRAKKEMVEATCVW